MSSPVDVSVIIVNWNTRDILGACLTSVFAETRGVSFEVIVVDNGSTDGSKEMIRREFPQLALIANSENRGFGRANNQAIARAVGRYVLLLNSDTVLLDGAIQKSVAFADSHPDAGAVGCRVLSKDKALTQNCIMHPSLLNLGLGLLRFDQLFPHHPFFDRERMGAWTYDSVRDVPSLGGCFLLLRSEALRQVGGFDERYFMYCEEIDLCRRLQSRQWRILFFPGAEIVHLYRASSRRAPDRMLLQRRRSLLLFLADTQGVGTAWLANVMCLLTTLAKTPVWIAWAVSGYESGTNCPTTLESIAALLHFHVRGLLWPRWGQESPARLAHF